MLKNNSLKHISIILDGNQRWSDKKKLNIYNGYEEGLKKIDETISNSLDLKIKYLTLFTLSSENYKRNSVSLIYDIISKYFQNLLQKIIKEKKVRIRIIGKRENLPKKIIKIFEQCESLTKNNNKLNLFLAFNYGFKDEIKHAFLKYKNNSNLNIEKEKNLRELFYLKNIPDPDLLIRTGGYRRLSNFIMLNLTYTELFFTNTLWPDFSRNEYFAIVNEYKKINRKYGL